MDLHLLINNTHLELGAKQDLLATAQLLRPRLLLGFMTRIALRPWLGDYNDLRWAKNPTFEIFDDARTFSRGNDPQAVSPDEMYGTSVFVVLREDRAIQIHLQLFENFTFARGLAHDFRKIAMKRFGACRHSEKQLFPCLPNNAARLGDTAITVWSDETSNVICELGGKSDQCVIRYIESPLPKYIESRLTCETCDANELWEKSEIDEMLISYGFCDRSDDD